MNHSEVINTKPPVTVILCSHNPKREYLEKVLDALNNQTLGYESWQLLLVDNASSPPIDKSVLESFRGNSQLLKVSLPGKVYAMAGVASEVKGDWVVFVDDDNVLEPDYLESLLNLHRNFPQIGVFSASITGSFETPVPEWALPFLRYLAVRKVPKPKWANCHPAPVGPVGAGMCVRSDLYREFVKLVAACEISAGLGRTQGKLSAGTDDTIFMDIAFRFGFGCGAFPELKLHHLIPANRLELNYLKRLVRDITHSHTVLEAQRNARKLNIFRSTVRLALDQIALFKEPSRQARMIKRAQSYGSWSGKFQIWKQRRGRNI